jgi:hypothetical protein
MKRLCWLVLMLSLTFAGPRPAIGGDFYAGAAGGIATLKADGRSLLSGSGGEISLYKPENGAALNIFAGWDFSDYASLQGNYIWNRNNLSLVSSSFGAEGTTDYQQTRSSQQNSAMADLLVYFRRRKSPLRPYLSLGAGVVSLNSTEQALVVVTGSPAIPPRTFSAVNPGLRVAVGLDFRLRNGLYFRYSFSDTISANPISSQLSPPGLRDMENFQNLFGLFKRF